MNDTDMILEITDNVIHLNTDNLRLRTAYNRLLDNLIAADVEHYELDEIMPIIIRMSSTANKTIVDEIEFIESIEAEDIVGLYGHELLQALVLIKQFGPDPLKGLINSVPPINNDN